MNEGSAHGTDNRGGLVDGAFPLVVTAAHELKSPLALIRQLALGLELGHYTQHEAVQIARQITLTSERALRLTRNLTQTTKLEDSLFSLHPLNPAVICEEAAEEILPLYQARGRELQVISRRTLPAGLANRDLLRRVLIGFLDNALYYAEPGAKVALTLATRQRGSRIRMSVRDRGPALPGNVWQRIEQSIGGMRQPLHARPESSGLGMYIARQFAQAMQAEIGAVRHRDGVSFYIDIDASTQMRLL